MILIHPVVRVNFCRVVFAAVPGDENQNDKIIQVEMRKGFTSRCPHRWRGQTLSVYSYIVVCCNHALNIYILPINAKYGELKSCSFGYIIFI